MVTMRYEIKLVCLSFQTFGVFLYNKLNRVKRLIVLLGKQIENIPLSVSYYNTSINLPCQTEYNN